MQIKSITDTDIQTIREGCLKNLTKEQYEKVIALYTDIITRYEVDSSYLEKSWKKGEVLLTILSKSELQIKAL